MAIFHRRDAPPASALAVLAPGERVVSWADAADGRVVLATPRGIWWPDGAVPRLIGWQFVSKAVWRERVLTVVEAAVHDDLIIVDLAPVSIELAIPRNLPPTVRKRVETNVVHSEVAPILGGAARLVARRVPGEDGLRWWARLEPGTADSPQVRAALDARLGALRADWLAVRGG